MSWLPFHLKQCKTQTRPHHATQRERSVNTIWFCILCNKGFLRIMELITEILTASIAKNATYIMENTYSKIINVADCKTCKNRLLAVKYLILILYTYPTAKTGTVYKSTDGPCGRQADNLTNSDWLRSLIRTAPKLTVRVYWQPRPPIWQWFGSDTHPDLNWRSINVATTNAEWISWMYESMQHDGGSHSYRFA